MGGGERVGVAVGALRVDVDEAHLHGGERILQLTLSLVALVGEPLGLGAPVDVLLRLPHVGTAAGESEGLKAHALQGDVAREDHEVGPADGGAVLLLDRPQQATGLVEVGVVRPAVERGEAEHASSGTAAAVADPVRAGAVPGHPDEERTVVPPVGGPPLLGVGHDLDEVRLDRGEVQLLKGFRVVEVVAHRVGRRAVHAEDVEVELVRPPIGVPGAAAGPVVELAVEEGTLGSVRHRIEVHIRLGFALSNLGAFKPKPTPKAKVETKAGRQGHPSHRSGPKIHPFVPPFGRGQKRSPTCGAGLRLRRDRDSNSGTKNIGHSLAGCCITTLPPLRGAFPSESGPRIYRKTFR